LSRQGRRRGGARAARGARAAAAARRGARANAALANAPPARRVELIEQAPGAKLVGTDYNGNRYYENESQTYSERALGAGGREPWGLAGVRRRRRPAGAAGLPPH
jgi:hypothetical protein